MRQLSRRQRRAATALALVAVLFCALDLAGAPFAGARAGVQGFLGALYRGADPVVGPPRRWVQALPHLAGDERTIAVQRQRIAELSRDRDAARQDAATADAVARLQLQADRGGYAVLPARVTAIGAAAGFDWTVVLDAGAEDGVRVDQTVLSGGDLVGRVIRAGATSATVLLAADPGSSIGVRDQRSGEIGVVAGHGTGDFSYIALDPSSRPRVGDVLVTGPDRATRYVAGLTVGTVSSVVEAMDGSVRTTVHAAAGPSTLDVLGVALVDAARPTARNPARPALTPAGPAPAGSTPAGSTPASPIPAAAGGQRR